MNQYLARLVFSRVKPLLILSALLTSLFMVTACGGVTIQPTKTIFKDPVGDKPCVTNPFGKDCTADVDVVDQVTFCRDDTKKTDTKAADCEDTISGVCSGNPFDSLCADDPMVQVEQVAFCRDDSKTTTTKDTDCAGDLITNACVANPFDSLCVGAYLVDETDRLAFCRDTDREPADKATNCAGTITTYCDTPANKFNDGCNNEVGIDAERTQLCLPNKTLDATRCPTLVMNYCDDDNNKFNAGCNNETDIDAERTQLCLPNQTLDSTRCPTLVMNYCDDDNNKFNDGCNNEAGIDAERTQLCLPNQTLDATRCPTLVMNYCDDDNNKFNDGCNNETGIDDERTQLCLPNQTLDSTRCPTLVMNYCDDDNNKFNDGCNNEAGIDAERTQLCLPNQTLDATRCPTLVMNYCDDDNNKFNAGCNNETDIDAERTQLCLPNQTLDSTRCPTLVMNYCDDDNNKFNAGCNNETDIDAERTQLCLPNQTLDSTRCPTLVMNYCDDDNNKFNDGCNNEIDIDAERTQLCLPNQALDATRCPTLVMNYCDDDNNKFNDGCNNEIDIDAERTQLCLPNQALDATRCPTLVMNYCDDDNNKFNAGCNNEANIASERTQLCLPNPSLDATRCPTLVMNYCDDDNNKFNDGCNNEANIASERTQLCLPNPSLDATRCPTLVMNYCDDDNNKFNDGCNNEAGIDAERTQLCLPNQTLDSTRCPTLVMNYCDDDNNKFNAGCNNEANIASERTQLCLPNQALDATRCPTLVMNYCDDDNNKFNDGCNNETDINAERTQLCLPNQTLDSTRCPTLVMNYCDDDNNKFNDGCNNEIDIDAERTQLCLPNQALDATRCPTLVMNYCDDDNNKFNDGCNNEIDIDAERTQLCLPNQALDATRCPTLVMNYCDDDNNKFNAGCNNEANIASERTQLCLPNPSLDATRCPTLVMNYCDDDNNKFNDGCNNEANIASERTQLCLPNPSLDATRCPTLVMNYCDDDNNKFNDGCNNEAGIDAERTQLCLPNQTLDSTRCPTLVMNYCDDDNNKFNAGCNNEANIASERTQLCLPNQALDATRCPTLVMNYCDDDNNKFNDGCNNETDINAERTQLCLPNQALDATRCPTLVMNYCDDDNNKFNDGCNNETDIDAERTQLCLPNPSLDSTRCPTLVMNYCDDDNNKFNDGCNNEIDIDAERTQLCLPNQALDATRCPTLVMNYCDDDNNKFNDGCNNETGIDDERTQLCLPNQALDATRCPTLVMNYCDIDKNKFATGCNNESGIAAERGKLCVENTAPDRSGCGTELVSGGYIYTYCNSGAGLEDTMNCSDTIGAVLLVTCAGNPWADGCIATNYYSERLAFCAPSATLPEGEDRATVCPPLAEITCRDGDSSVTPDPFHATCFAAGNPFANARANLCSTGMKTGNDCNTIPIEAAVCAASGAYANPFAAFCGDETGTSTSSTISTVIQDALNTCTDTNMDGDDGICENTLTDRTRLSDETCIVTNPIALFATECDYTQFRDVEIDYCDEPVQTWEGRCSDVSTETKVLNARNAACLVSGKNAGTGNNCETRDNVRMVCNKDPYTKITADGITALCTGTNAMDVNYSVARDACEAPATSFDATCNSQDNIGKVKMARDMACAEFGIAAGAEIMAINDCATRQNIMDTCTTASPFANDGCDTATHITLEIREAFCTNGTANIFNLKCGLLTDTIDLIDGTNNARETACLNSQIDMPIDDSCRTNGRVVGACTTDPFTKVGCGNVNTIVGIRDTFCTETNIFDERCGNVNEYGATNEARRNVCLADVAGTLSDPSCATDALAEIACAPDPFNAATPGCANLDKNTQYRIAYCTTGLNIFSSSCVDGMHGAVNLARDTECRKTGTSTLKGNTCADIVSMRCIANPFEKTTSDTSVNLCVGDNYDTDREIKCRKSGTSDLGSCDETISSLCSNNPFIKTTVGTAINLCDSSYDDDRKAECLKTGSSALTGNTCLTLLPEACRDNPFEIGTVSKVLLCVDTDTSGTDYAGARKTACLKGTAEDGMAGGKCYTLAHGSDGMTGFCDGADETDNPFAAVCGENGDNQTAFCAPDGAGTTNPQLCSRSLAVVCPNTPFRNSGGIDCLGSEDYDNHRAEDCSDGTQTDASLCNTQKIADAVCISDSNSTYANPFAAFCATEDTRTVDSTLTKTQVRQTFCGNTQRTSSTGLRGNACDGLLDGLCSGANSFLTMVGAADYNCSLDMTRTVNAARVRFCEDPITTFSADCTSDHGDVAGTRRTECLKTGTVDEDIDPMNVICNNVVMTACIANPFQKATVNTNIDLCVDISGTTYADARETECRKTGTSILEGSDCLNIVSTRCNANPFELTTESLANLCDETAHPRLAFCRDTDRDHGDKASNCMSAIGVACTADRFAQKTGTTGGNLCPADHPADLAFCLDNNKSAPKKMMNCVRTYQTACVNNPFDALCINEYSTNDTEKLTFCRDATKTPADKSTNCSGSLIETACVANPFDSLCIGAYLVNTTDRLAFCRDTDRDPAGKEYTCAGTTPLIMNACLANPFDTLCSAITLGNTANKLQFCRGTRTHADKARNCSGELIQTACNANPFDGFCVGEYKKTDTEKLTFCRADSTSQLLIAAHCTSGALADLACSVNVYDRLCVGNNFNPATEVEFCRDTDRPHAEKADNCAASLAVGRFCRANPFEKTTGTTVGNFCDETTYDRLAFCSSIDRLHADKAANCGDTITNACDANPFEKTNSQNIRYTPVYLCASNYLTVDYRLAFCRDPSRNTNNLSACAGTIITACNANPFEEKTGGGNLCDETTYDRLAFCRGNIAHDDKDTNCSGQLITDACDTNPFDTLCTGDYLTYDHRLAFCRDTDKQPAGKDDDCMGTIDTACTADRFAQTTGGTPTDLCPPDHAADLVFCNNGTDKTPTQTTQCSFVRTVCPDNPFDSRCSVDIVARVAFCRGDKTHMDKDTNCMGTIAGVCTANPFDTLCTGAFLVNDTDRLAFCLDTDRTPDTKTADCMVMISTACGLNPFEETTGSTAANLCDEATYPRLAFCRNSSKLHNDKDTLCRNTITNACNINPFEKTTGGTPADLCPEAYTTQLHRETFCRSRNKIPKDQSSDCSAILAPICRYNPFEQSTDRSVRLCIQTEAILDAFCRDTSKTPRLKQSNCLNTFRRICETANNPPDPFEYAAYCGITLTTQLKFCRAGQMKNKVAGNDDIFREVECNQARSITCEANPNNRFCLDDNAGAVTIGDLLRSLDAPLAKSSAAQSEGHQFLQIDSDVTGATSLNLGNAMFDGLRLNVDGSGSNDGVVFWQAKNSNYVGLASGTDLGTPLEERLAVAQMIWRGEIDAIGTEEHGTVNSDLTVNINFYAGLDNGNVGWIEAVSADSENIDGRFGGGRGYSFNGTFNTAGVLRGTATLRTTRNFPEENPAITGQLRGLIGAEGIVGAFLGSSTAGDFVGGFVAQPDIAPARAIVDDAAWVAFWVASSLTDELHSSPPTSEKRVNQFLKHSAVLVQNQDINIPNPEEPSDEYFSFISETYFLARSFRTRGNPVRLNSGGLGSVYYRSGFTLWVDNDTTRYYYAGLSSDANVGLTIHPDPVHHPANVDGLATWSGQFAATRNGENGSVRTDRVFPTHKKLDLLINFTNKSVLGTVRNGPTFGSTVADHGRFDIDGRWNPAGILTGSVNQVIDVAEDAPPHEDSGFGSLTGIIGDRGALGAFISYGTGKQGYSGGFFVCPNYNAATGQCP